MKKRILLLFVICSLTLPLAALLSSCADNGSDLLYSVTDGDIVYELYGGSRPNRIRAVQGEKTIWEKKISVKKNVGDRGGTYGFEVLDLNFDGVNDLKLAIAASGDELTEVYFMRDPETGKYRKSGAFAGLYTLGTDPGQKVIFSFTHKEKIEKVKDALPVRTITDTTTAYVWKDGVLAPYRRVSLTYYSAQDIYCYSVSDFSEETGDFREPDDKWLTPEAYEQTDFSFLYYFRK